MGAARGAKRFLYVHDRALTEEGPNETTRRPYRALPFTGGVGEAGGEWIDETYQLHDGKYFASRYHLRVYESPYESDEWVAIQAHSDHWDWFRLRHTVHDTENAQDYVESEFWGIRPSTPSGGCTSTTRRASAPTAGRRWSTSAACRTRSRTRRPPGPRPWRGSSPSGPAAPGLCSPGSSARTPPRSTAPRPRRSTLPADP
ncbi:hypothetical protein ACFQL4_06885 [Halosimplex aquaticum]